MYHDQFAPSTLLQNLRTQPTRPHLSYHSSAKPSRTFTRARQSLHKPHKFLNPLKTTRINCLHKQRPILPHVNALRPVQIWPHKIMASAVSLSSPRMIEMMGMEPAMELKVPSDVSLFIYRFLSIPTHRPRQLLAAKKRHTTASSKAKDKSATSITIVDIDDSEFEGTDDNSTERANAAKGMSFFQSLT